MQILTTMEGDLADGFSLAPEEIKPYNFEPISNNIQDRHESESEDSEGSDEEGNAAGGMGTRRENTAWYRIKTNIIIFNLNHILLSIKHNRIRQQARSLYKPSPM